MDFACENINVEQVLKCSFGLTKAGCAVMRELLTTKEWMRSEELAEATQYDLATVQRALKHLNERGVVQRVQHNLTGGGYEFTYHIVNDKEFYAIVEETLTQWMQEAKSEVKQWLNEA